MAKKKPRARKTSATYTLMVQKYLDRHPDANRKQIASSLKLTVEQVSGILTRLRVTGRLPKTHGLFREKTGKSDGATFTAADVLAVKKVGVEKIKAILKLLEQL